jgi:hypothetical protein
MPTGQRKSVTYLLADVRFAIDRLTPDKSDYRTSSHEVLGFALALETLSTYNKKAPMDISPSASALCIVAPPTGRQFLSKLSSTLRSLADRIAKLHNMAITR